MPNVYSFLQTAYHFVKSLVVNVTKKMYRTAVVLTTSLAVVTVVTFNSGSFSGAGKNAAAAFYEEDGDESELSDTMQSEGITSDVGVKMELRLTASKEQGQQLVGNLLQKNIQDNLAKSALGIEVVEKEVLMQAAQAKAEAEEKVREEQARLKKERGVITYTDQDYDVLLKIVQAEAGICDTQGKIMVANVIINRVRSSEFPDNITDVVYEKSQFSPVIDGTIDTCVVTQATRDCVDRALEGEDYSQGALYFMNRGGSESSNVNWFDGRLTFVTQHQRHEFFK